MKVAILVGWTDVEGVLDEVVRLDLIAVDIADGDSSFSDANYSHPVANCYLAENRIESN